MYSPVMREWRISLELGLGGNVRRSPKMNKVSVLPTKVPESLQQWESMLKCTIVTLSMTCAQEN